MTEGTVILKIIRLMLCVGCVKIAIQIYTLDVESYSLYLITTDPHCILACSCLKNMLCSLLPCILTMHSYPLLQPVNPPSPI
jgi:hypothetical protein